MRAPASQVSLIIPLLDEAATVPELYRRSVSALLALGRPFDILCVDDGSTDGTFEALAALAAYDPRLKLLRFDRHYGQTAALAAGFDHARGETIVTMDGDLQNDPADIGALLERLESGADMVCGWRRQRRDPTLSRRLPSWVANWLIARASGVALHDHGCTLKAIRGSLARRLGRELESHRFLAVQAARLGARIAEVEVRHHPRRAGRSKYGMERTPRVVLDLFRLRLDPNRIGRAPVYRLRDTD